MSDKISTAVKIQRLQERLLNGSKARQEQQDKQVRQEAISQRLKVLDQRLHTAQVSENSRISSLKEQVSKLQEGLVTEKTSRELLDDRKSKELKLLENTLTVELAMATKNHLDVESKLEMKIEDDFNQLKMAIVEERKLREKNHEQYHKQLQHDLTTLTQEIESDRKVNEEASVKTVRSLVDEIRKLEESIQQDRKIRDETETGLVQMLQDTFLKLRNEIQSERKNRESAEETILRILEEVCDPTIKPQSHK